MSQLKTSKGSKTTEQENGTQFKSPSVTPEPDIEGGINTTELPKNQVQTRSRSKTPLLVGTPEKTPHVNDSKPIQEDSPTHNHNTRSKLLQNKTPPQEITKDQVIEGIPEETEQEIINNKSNTSLGTAESNSSEVDELVVDKDEIELQFEEVDVEVESEGSPNRCKTRRSQVPNVSTPKTPKLIEDEEFVAVDFKEIPDQDTSDTHSSVSVDNISTVALADVTRNVDFSQDSVLLEDSKSASPDCSANFREGLRNISARRPIHQSSGDNYRKYALENSHQNHQATFNYDVVERVTGVKRKSSSIPLNEPKKFKESFGFLSYISLPIYNFKNSFATNTAKVVPHTEKEQLSDYNTKKIDINVGVKENEHRWCSIM